MLRLVAHELRAHLTVLNGYSALLRDDERVRRDPSRMQRALTEISSHLATLNDISRHLVDAVDPERARPGLPTAMADVDLSGAAREALDMTEEAARRHRVSLRLDAGTLGTDPVFGDRFQLVVAMRNLLDNACAHGPEGDDVTLEVGRSGGDVVIRTRDQGAGLDQLGGSAFEPLRRGGSRKEEQGMGLGLSLVAEVARSHGGEVTWGHDEQGATVGLRFPDRGHA